MSTTPMHLAYKSSGGLYAPVDSDSKPKKFEVVSACNLIIAINILVMAAIALKTPSILWFPGKQALIDMGGNYGVLTFTGQYWRVVTSMFLHIGIIHLGLNLYGLRCVGATAESLFGWRLFLLIYFFSGIMGALTSVWHDPLTISVGASGAILGVFGSLLAFLYVQRDKYPKQTLLYHAAFAVGLFIAMIVFGSMETGVDNFNHGGGFIAGSIAGLILARLEVKERQRMAYAIPVMMLMIGLWFWAIHHNFERRGFADYAAASEELKAKHYEQAVASLNAFIARNQTEANAYGMRAIAYLKWGKLDNALQDYDKVLIMSPESAGANNDRAWTECGLGEYDKAIEDATTSLKIEKSSAAFDTRGYAYAHSGQTDKALSDFADGLKLNSSETACHYHRMKLYDSIGKPADAAKDRALGSSYQPEPWER